MRGSLLRRWATGLRRPVLPGGAWRTRGVWFKMIPVGAVLVFCMAATGELLPEPAPPPGPAVGLLPVTHWQGLFDTTAAAEREMNLRLSKSDDSWDYYNLAYQIDANVSMLEATRESRYADFALTLAENMIRAARRSSAIPTSGFKDGYLGWVTTKREPRGEEVPLYESYSWRYVTRLLRVLRTSPLYEDTSYRARYQKVLAFSEKNIFDKWFTRDPAKFIYRERTHMAAHWAYISLDLMRLTTDAELRQRYRQVVANIDNDLPNHPSSLRGQLQPSRSDPGAYWWSDVWGRKKGYGQDVAHGNGVISYVVESCDLDAGWTRQEMARFSRTLTAFVLGRNGKYPAYVSGRGSGTGWLADGFVKLGRYDRAVQGALEKHGVQNSQFHASMALNAHILGRARP